MVVDRFGSANAISSRSPTKDVFVGAWNRRGGYDSLGGLCREGGGEKMNILRLRTWSPKVRYLGW